jgi:type IV pilus assembly protein PilA
MKKMTTETMVTVCDKGSYDKTVSRGINLENFSQQDHKALKRNLQEKGFSLVELMVVVAIIGILATIAIPKVTRFIAKSRQTEAQINLSSIYTYNKNFYLEYQGYTNDFFAMGYQPEGNLRYNTGFDGAPMGPINYTTLTTRNYGDNNNQQPGGGLSGSPTSTLNVCPVNNSQLCVTLNGADNQPPPQQEGTSVVAASFDSFIAQARACLVKSRALNPGNSTTCVYDSWIINDVKQLRNNQMGID